MRAHVSRFPLGASSPCTRASLPNGNHHGRASSGTSSSKHEHRCKHELSNLAHVDERKRAHADLARPAPAALRRPTALVRERLLIDRARAKRD